MATTSFSDNVVVTGSRDVAQIEVKGTAAQTQALQAWEDSAADVLAQIASDGRFQIGDSGTSLGLSSPDALIEAHRDDSSTSKPKRGFHSLGRISDTLSNVAQWIVQELEVRGSNNLSALQTALRVRASNMNTGNRSQELKFARGTLRSSMTQRREALPCP